MIQRLFERCSVTEYMALPSTRLVSITYQRGKEPRVRRGTEWEGWLCMLSNDFQRASFYAHELSRKYQTRHLVRKSGKSEWAVIRAF
jgi:hypothetical protein